jgi:hypothetical protein
MAIKVRFPAGTEHIPERIAQMEAAVSAYLGIEVHFVAAPPPAKAERQRVGTWVDFGSIQPVYDRESLRPPPIDRGSVRPLRVNSETTSWEDWSAEVDALCAEVQRRETPVFKNFT